MNSSITRHIFHVEKKTENINNFIEYTWKFCERLLNALTTVIVTVIVKY